MSRQNLTRLMMGASLFMMVTAASAAHAATAAAAPAGPAPTMTGAGAEGTDVSELVVTAEANHAAAEAPAKASLDQVQPESIITRKFIEQATPETGDWTSVVAIAPSISGITSNGGNIGEYNKVSMRGFQDGQFNITYDGISFGDTNDPTHHSASYFPASTIGTVVVDRGPGAAGDMGQANFGGAIHYHSPDPTDTFGVSQKVTAASFGTYAAVTTLNTGATSTGAKLLLNFDTRTSNGELTHSGGYADNIMGKFVMPVGSWTFTAFGAREYTHFNLADAGPGATWLQILDYGKNFALTAIPGDEHNYHWNYESKASDFEYVDAKGTVMPTVTAEDQLYTYFYTNKTTATNSINDLIGSDTSSVINVATKSLGELATDVGGYDKLNQYRVWGNVVRINKEFPFGVLKVGGLTEISTTDRHNLLLDFTDGFQPDLKYTTKANPLLPAATNAKLQENSDWFQYQVFADFEIHVGDNLKLTPGVKFVDFKRDVNAANENVAGLNVNGVVPKDSPLIASNTYSSPLYFFTGNYKITPYWSVYGQVATSFLIPSLSDLYTSGASVQNLQPEKATTYQAGTVYSRGNLTADFDLYQVNASNFVNACTVPDPTPVNPAATASGFCNYGTAQYNGFEGEVAYSLPYGFNLFANGSSNVGKTQATAANAAAGIAAAPAQAITNAPRWTDAAGVIYDRGPWTGTLTYKQSGTFVAKGSVRLPGYDTLDASGAYDFGHFKLKLQVFNIFDKRAITAFNGSTLYSTTDSGLYQFQAGRQFQATLQAKF
jgi:iron complex outermembrane receptor protein